MKNNKIFSILLSSILAGVMISIGSVAYLAVNNITIGALLFCIGLLSILYYKLNLYTGKISYITKLNELSYIMTVLLGNLIGCCLMFAFPNDNATNIILTKMDSSYIILFIEAMLCNILIYIAVETFNNKYFVVTILAVMVFVVAGFEHSIASMCLIISSRLFNVDTLLYMTVVTIGNAIGGILFHRLRRMIINEI